MAAAIPRASSPARVAPWRRLVAVAAMLVALLPLYWPAWASLHALWVDGNLTTYTHGYLIVGLSAWLLFRDRDSLVCHAWSDWSLAQRCLLLVALVAVVLLWQLMFRAGILIATQALLPILVWLSVAVAFGRGVARASLFPLAFLYFAIPIWDYFNPFVHELTVRAVRVMLRAIGIPVYFVDDEVHIPEGVFAIEDGCSGLHFLMVALAIGSLAAQLRGSGLRGRLGWAAFAAGLAILVNWFRVSTIVLLGHYTDMQHYVVRVSHYYYGWVLFALALIMFFAIERRVTLPSRTPAPAPAPAPAPMPETESGWRPTWLLVAAAIAVLPWAMNRVIDASTAIAPETASLAPANWVMQAASGEIAASSAWRPEQQRADAETLRRYAREGQAVEVYEATYLEQRPGKKLGGAGNRLQGAADVVATGMQATARGTWGEMIVSQRGERHVLWYQYLAVDRTFVSATRAQFAHGFATLLSLRSSVAGVRAVRAPCRDDCTNARETLRRFLSDEG